MICILDPSLFVLSTDDAAELERIEGMVRHAVRICRDFGAAIPTFAWYWGQLQRELIGPLAAKAHPKLRQGLDTLRSYLNPEMLRSISDASDKVKMWGVRPLFSWPQLNSAWLPIMERLLMRCARSGEQTVMIVRLVQGRNAIIHQNGGCQLVEKTRWRLYVNASGAPPFRIPCVQTRRNVAVDWTTRFDERLPAKEDVGASHPFCPPKHWWKRDVVAFRTHKSRTCWLDANQNAWARPSTGGGHHWDVYITKPSLRALVGLNQLNIVEWGAPSSEGTPGTIHHVPGDKQPHLIGTGGWDCPD